MASPSSSPTFKDLFLLISTIMLTVTVSSLTTAADDHQVYVVFMDPGAMPKPFSDQEQWYTATLSSISPTAKLVYSYSHVVHGFSAALTPSELSSLEKSPGFLHSVKSNDRPIEYTTTYSSSEFLGLSSCCLGSTWDHDHQAASNCGEGMIIGVVDRGIWPEHRSFDDHGMSPPPAARWKGGCGFSNQSLCNNKLIGAQLFNRSLSHRRLTPTEGGNVLNMTATNDGDDDRSPRDHDGHGTFTSSIAAGNFVDGVSSFGYASGTARGVAPRAHLAMYKPVRESDILAAIDRAVGDGVYVLSLSFGTSDHPFYEDSVALGTFAAAVEKNVFVSAAAGNLGPSRQTLSNAIPWVLTVAAGSVDRQFQARIELGNGVSFSGWSFYVGSYVSSGLQAPIIFREEYCLNTTEDSVRGKIVVCQEKDYLPADYHILNAGAAGIFYLLNHTFSAEDLMSTGSFPRVYVTLRDGEAIRQYCNSSTEQPKEARLTFGITKLGAKPAPGVATFSSRGPSVRCPHVLKPDIMGPGSMILGALPPHSSDPDFIMAYGTSMSTPHLAGVAAIIKKAHPDWSTAAVRSAMMTTADALDNAGQPIQDLGNWRNTPAAGLDMGAGQVNPRKAMDPGLVYDH